VFFSLRSTNPVALEHVDQGHAAVVCEQGYIAVFSGDKLTPVARVEDIPLTLGGLAEFNVQNALAATAAAWAYGVDVDEIRRGLLSFLPSLVQTPGRLNQMTIDGVDYLLDYAHNPHAYKSLVQLVGRLGERRRIVVFDVVGDRRDEDIEEVCGVLAPVFDTAVIYEAGDLRGRAPGELMDLQERYLTAAGMDAAAIERVPVEQAAIERAAELARPGDLVCCMTGRVHEAIQWLRERAEGGRATAGEAAEVATADATGASEGGA
jgi:cyanophycin synthetase